MAKIKTLRVIDIAKVREMISMLSTSEVPSYLQYLVLQPLNFVQGLLPLKLRKLPEYYVAIEDKVVHGMISVSAERGNAYKWNIKELFLNKNAYLAGRQLVDYIVAKYGAMGANTFSVVVEDTHEELIDLFSKGCGFRLCSHESLWQMNKLTLSEPSESGDVYRPFKNSDAKAVCEMYNDSIYPHFRYSLARAKSEFYDIECQGLSKSSYFKYVVDDANTKEIKAYIEIQTSDNFNFMLDIVVSQGYSDYYSDVMNFAVSQILRRKKDFNLFVLNRKYIMSGKKNEEYLKEHDFSMIRNQMVLVKDFFKTIREDERISRPAIAFTEMKGKPAFKLNNEDTL